MRTMRDPEVAKPYRYRGKKRFGIESWHDVWQRWTRAGWFHTESARDEALKNLESKMTILKMFRIETKHRKVQR